MTTHPFLLSRPLFIFMCLGVLPLLGVFASRRRRTDQPTRFAFRRFSSFQRVACCMNGGPHTHKAIQLPFLWTSPLHLRFLHGSATLKVSEGAVPLVASPSPDYTLPPLYLSSLLQLPAVCEPLVPLTLVVRAAVLHSCAARRGEYGVSTTINSR
jgi:hypothetical protein